MKRTFMTTDDGSMTIHIPEWNEQYHSKHGAIQEAVHVFIETGLQHYLNKNTLSPVKILEIGFGTGLNAFLTLLKAEEERLQIDYTGIEKYPVGKDEFKKLNYAQLLKASKTLFLKLHEIDWEEKGAISKHFQLTKRVLDFNDIEDKEIYNIIYYDAFGARVQPELWTESVFQRMFNALIENGVLVTYAAKGSVRRAMQAVGFTVERLPGPPGKREMLRATKKTKS